MSDDHEITAMRRSVDQSARILIIDNYDSYTYNLVQAVGRLVDIEPEVVHVDRFDPRTESEYAAIIVSPGPGHPATEPAFAACLELFATRTLPTLGVCLGHQGIIIVHGGTVDRLPPAHGELDEIEHTGTGLFEGVAPRTRVVRYHSLGALDVPPTLDVTARTDDGVVMAVAHKVLPHYGLQFHPESILTEEGTRMLQNFLVLAGFALREDPPEQDEATATPPGDAAQAAGPHVSLRYPEWIAPEIVASHLLRGRSRAFWLDSADSREWSGRFSLLGYLDPEDESVVVGGAEHAGAGVTAIPRAEFLRHLVRLSAEASPPAADAPPGVGGWVGIAGYDTQEILPSAEPGSPADGFFMRANRTVVFDHEHRLITCFAALETQVAQLVTLLDESRTLQSPAAPARIMPRSTLPREQYAAAYQRIDDALRRGDTYEAVLTFPLEFELDGDPLDHYLELRARSPAPYSAYLRHGAEVVLSASPERMLSVTRSGDAEVRPIKGTLPRSANAQGDAIARWRLATEDKFRRENLMITDLIRNDLGTVAVRGSVAVTQLMEVETYRGVHQLVSAISAKLRPEHGPIDCLRAVFPAGSMTGAPKRRTMELIRDVEWARRGLYSGSLGWFDRSRAEFSVVIRTLHGSNSRLRLHVGGGIIVGSDPDDELDEAMDKARSVATAPLIPS
ncbi:chorismate-binding protein [Microbacterium murale]|uniref:aminodeoxychorismate synthase n=1 Tax=Microbacterium murale TaxID=1081040 RepID=A0ABU0P7E6_9MICO|nr:chorismate-binding protein [Microbacterium murale]MDQ0643258.1 para-aminobenzoate synthetase [Microbacterium murale]